MENTKKKGIGIGTGLVISVAIIYILLGLAMLLIPRFETTYIIYAAGIVLLVYGIILIVKFFVGAGYRDLGDYSFSGGVLCIIIGICLLIRAAAVAQDFPLLLGICILFTAVVKLQNAMSLRSLENVMWPVFLVVSLVFVAASLIIILDIFHLNATYTLYIYMILVADGVINLIETLFLALVIRKALRAKVPADSPSPDYEEADTELLEQPEGSGTAEQTETLIEDILLPYEDSKEKEAGM